MVRMDGKEGAYGGLLAVGLAAGFFSLTLTPPVGQIAPGLGVVILKAFDYGMMAGALRGSWKSLKKRRYDAAAFWAGAGLFWAGMNLWDLVLLATGNFR